MSSFQPLDSRALLLLWSRSSACALASGENGGVLISPRSQARGLSREEEAYVISDMLPTRVETAALVQDFRKCGALEWSDGMELGGNLAG